MLCGSSIANWHLPGPSGSSVARCLGPTPDSSLGQAPRFSRTAAVTAQEACCLTHSGNLPTRVHCRALQLVLPWQRRVAGWWGHHSSPPWPRGSFCRVGSWAHAAAMSWHLLCTTRRFMASAVRDVLPTQVYAPAFGTTALPGGMQPVNHRLSTASQGQGSAQESKQCHSRGCVHYVCWVWPPQHHRCGRFHGATGTLEHARAHKRVTRVHGTCKDLGVYAFIIRQTRAGTVSANARAHASRPLVQNRSAQQASILPSAVHAAAEMNNHSEDTN